MSLKRIMVLIFLQHTYVVHLVDQNKLWTLGPFSNNSCDPFGMDLLWRLCRLCPSMSTKVRLCPPMSCPVQSFLDCMSNETSGHNPPCLKKGHIDTSWGFITRTPECSPSLCELELILFNFNFNLLSEY